MNIIGRINNYLESNHMSKSDLAKIANVSKSYVTMLLKGERAINIEILKALSELSGKSIDWWLHGTDQYLNLQSLNDLIDTFIENGYIKSDCSMEAEYKIMLDTMLLKEINLKLQKKNES